MSNTQRDSLGRYTSCNHYFVWLSDWGGDPSIPNGTFDCSRYECRHCDEPATPEQAQEAADRDAGAKEDAEIARAEMPAEAHDETY